MYLYYIHVWCDIDPQVHVSNLSINETTFEIALQFQVSENINNSLIMHDNNNRAMIHAEGVIPRYLLSLLTVWMECNRLLLVLAHSQMKQM